MGSGAYQASPLVSSGHDAHRLHPRAGCPRPVPGHDDGVLAKGKGGGNLGEARVSLGFVFGVGAGRLRFLVGAGSAFWGAWCLVLWVSSLEVLFFLSFFPPLLLFGVGSLFGAGLSMDIQREPTRFLVCSLVSLFFFGGWGWGEATCVLLCSCSEPIFHCGVSRDSKLKPRWVWFLALSLGPSQPMKHQVSRCKVMCDE